jgi:hypothetical protein
MLKALLTRLFGGGSQALLEEWIPYNGYRICPTPYRRRGQFQTCGVIEKEVGGETKQHRFVRAETHASREGADFAIAKARQLIDEQGERLFG